jgi:1A family penicillin-binding protein
MPIPQLKKTGFQSRQIGDSKPKFASHNINSDIRKKKKRPKKRPLASSDRIKRARKKSWPRRLLRRLWPFILGGALLLGIFIIILFVYYSKDLPEPGKIMDRSVALSAKIFDRTGETLLYEIHGPENRTLIDIEELPDYVINATIAIEDKNFYEHKGISLWGIIRGQIVPRLQGRRAQGGSTLTQQFVKNAILTNERKLSRKIKEWILSYRIESKYSKQEILQFYFNEIPYGSSAYGVESAAHYYFGTAAKDLTLAQAAVLASLPQAPSYYSPYGSNKDLLINRQQTVLNLMEEQDYITSVEAEAAKAEELIFKKRVENIKAPHFVLYVREFLENKYGTTNLEQSGWKITTSLDWDLQQIAEATVEEKAEINLENWEANNAALVSIDVETSQILAMVGSKDYFDDEIDGQVNVAVAKRQPGSSMKPLAYLSAFQRGFRPETVVFDLVTDFASGGDSYEPHNYDLEEHGPVTMRQALAGSLNIAAVKTLYLAGVYNTLDLAAEFGYNTLTERDRYGLSLVLGGGEVKLLEHVNAYATMAREGVFMESTPILKIEDSSGKVVEDNQENKGRRVIDKEPVRVLNEVLSDNTARAYVFGENNLLTLPGRPVASKTGTTNDYRDAWTIGFTPQIATGVWVGNNDNTEMKKGASGSQVAAPIWNKFMREATKDMAVMNFKFHDLDDCDKPMVCGELGGGDPVEIDTMSGKLATEFTPYTTREERQYLEVHNILHYVNTNDPLGDPLANPMSDPQYELWEEVVQKWAEEKGYTAANAPTEYDDIHLSHLQPSLSLQQPHNNQTITQGVFTMQVNASAPQGVERVEYFIDEELIGTAYSEPFNFTYQINPFLSNGQHKLTAIAFDDQDNFKDQSINIKLELDDSDRDFNILWIDPSNGDSISVEDLPISLQLNIDNPSRVKKLDFYYLDPEDQSHWFNYIESPSISNLSVGLTNELTPGVYKFYMIVKDRSNNLFTTPGIIVNFVE